MQSISRYQMCMCVRQSVSQSVSDTDVAAKEWWGNQVVRRLAQVLLSMMTLPQKHWGVFPSPYSTCLCVCDVCVCVCYVCVRTVQKRNNTFSSSGHVCEELKISVQI